MRHARSRCGWLARRLAAALLAAGGVYGMADLEADAADGGGPARGPLDPRGQIHLPVGIADAVDTLKTFVEAEGCFSPGVGSYGVYFWLYDPAAKKLTAATMPGVASRRGLAEGGALIPWTSFAAGPVELGSELCQVELDTPKGRGQLVVAAVRLSTEAKAARKVLLYAALRGLGPAGWPVRKLEAGKEGDALLVDGATAIVAKASRCEAGVAATDTIGDFAMKGELPTDKSAESAQGDCSGALRVPVTVPAGGQVVVHFICPVLPGRRAVGHDWDGTSGWAQADLAKPNPPEGGALQPDAGLAWYRALDAAKLFERARAYWRDLTGRATVRVPDKRWGEAFAAIAGHAAIAMNEGAPDVAVVNYNVFNRDGVYVADILQKAGRLDLSEAAIDYFLAHPFNGRTKVEADNPGQVLWAMGEHWLFGRDEKWLRRVYPSAAKLAAMIEYCRTKPGPHHVKATSLEFGDALPGDKPDEKPAHRKQVLQPGSCDGHHPEYTEAFDVAGLRAAAALAEALPSRDDAERWTALAEKLKDEYDKKFSTKLAAGYGSYCVLWPCRLYPACRCEGYGAFRGVGAQKPGGWRYFALARAHQGLLAGNREAGWGTLDAHLAGEQMAGWYVLDEGGRSGSGLWPRLRTTWNGAVAMPHGWAVAELYLLLRDCLLFEAEGKVVLLGGVRPEWFRDPAGMSFANMPTHFGVLSLSYRPAESGAAIELGGPCAPPDGFELRVPALRGLKAFADGKELAPGGERSYMLPAGTKVVRLTLAAD